MFRKEGGAERLMTHYDKCFSLGKSEAHVTRHEPVVSCTHGIIEMAHFSLRSWRKLGNGLKILYVSQWNKGVAMAEYDQHKNK